MTTLTTLASFNGIDGSEPTGLILIGDAAGDLFGTTTEGGANSVGAVFEITKTAGGYASTPTILVSFNGTGGGNYTFTTLVGSVPEITTATANPTSCGRTPTVRPRSG